jgi:sn-glycerol 3-phosphate transport system permease protein
MAAAIVIIGLALGLLIATMAYQPIKGARIYRTLLIWPYAVSPVVAGSIFLLLFNPAGGVINHVLGKLFGLNIPWLNDPNYAPWSVIIASVWKSLGFNILFYIAGLQNVPKDLQESGAIDGANALQRFYHITLPLLSPITFFLIVTNITYAFFETVGTVIYMTGGAGPLGSTNILMWRVYELGVQHGDLGKAAAQSIVLFLMVIGITVLQFRTTGERVTYGA